MFYVLVVNYNIFIQLIGFVDESIGSARLV